MSLPSSKVKDEEIDIVIVIAAIHSDLTIFMNEWRPIFSRYHLIVVKDPDLKEELQIPNGFNINVYTKSDIDQMVGSTPIIFFGYSCRYFGFLVSRKKYIVCVDVDCIPAKDEKDCILKDGMVGPI